MTAYNTEDRVRWEQYADAFRAWLARRGPYPGNPPNGYLDVYKVTQRYAPCPHEYPELVAAEHRPASNIPGVTMTADAFSAFLAHASSVNSQIVGLAQRTAFPVSQWDRRSAGGVPRFERADRGDFHRGRGRGRPRTHPHGPPLTDRIGEARPRRRDRPTRRSRRHRRDQPAETPDGAEPATAHEDAPADETQYEQQAGPSHAPYSGDNEVDFDGEMDYDGAGPMFIDTEEQSGFVNQA
ncbi:hypothetical protein C8Q77DRAFT_1161111 [Trametes polyzona]|nr:hypothetical protein C8Q77DRAFT_1161111 [Trametes polyzona]